MTADPRTPPSPPPQGEGDAPANPYARPFTGQGDPCPLCVYGCPMSAWKEGYEAGRRTPSNTRSAGEERRDVVAFLRAHGEAMEAMPANPTSWQGAGLRTYARRIERGDHEGASSSPPPAPKEGGAVEER